MIIPLLSFDNQVAIFQVGLIVSKALLVISMYSSAFSGKIFNGDFIVKINNESIRKKAQVYEALENFLKNHEKVGFFI